MQIQTGWAPVFATMLLFVLALMSISAWQRDISSFSVRDVQQHIVFPRESTRNVSVNSSGKQSNGPDSSATAFIITVASSHSAFTARQTEEFGPLIAEAVDDATVQAEIQAKTGEASESIVPEVAQPELEPFSDQDSKLEPVYGYPIERQSSGGDSASETKPPELNQNEMPPIVVSDSNQYEAETNKKTTGLSDQHWVEPEQLLEQLRSLTIHPITASWAETTVDILLGISGNNGLADPQTQISFQQLHKQLEIANGLIAKIFRDPATTPGSELALVATHLKRTQYSIQRRLGIWEAVHLLASNQSLRIQQVSDQRVSQFLTASSRKLNIDEIDRGWAQYLELDVAAESFNAISPNAFEQKKSARKVLARLYSPALSQNQKKHLARTIDNGLVEALRSKAVEPVDLVQFLDRVERFESDSNGVSQYYLNDDYQNLLWSGEVAYEQLAQHLQSHYRNANVRVTVSEKLLNNLVPEVPDSFEPFRDRIFGARVYGENQISNQIRIRLIPDPTQISIRLETSGQVRSQTLAERSGFTIENEGNSRFKVMKRLVFGRHGIFAYRPETESEMNQQVVGMRSKLDGIPLIGWMARRIAHKKIEQQTPMTEQYARQKLERTAEGRFEQEVEDNLNQLRYYVTNNLLQPLIAMDLEPEPVEISTTAQKILMSLPIGRCDQMAANTPRPQALQSSLMSIQVHETAINNLIGRIELAGKTFDPIQLQQHLRDVLGGDVFANADKIERDVEFEFAPFDPVRVDLDDNQIGLSVNLKSFRIGKGKTWKNLQIKTKYDPTVRGLKFALSQDESGIELKGKRLNAADYIAIRTIFSSLFESHIEFAALPQSLQEKLGSTSLAVSQLVVTNGWIGVSVDDLTQTEPVNMTRSEPRRTRVGGLRSNLGSSPRR